MPARRRTGQRFSVFDTSVGPEHQLPSHGAAPSLPINYAEAIDGLVIGASVVRVGRPLTGHSQ